MSGLVEVGHYGIHSAEGVAFLLQRGSAQNAFGLDLPSPYKVRQKPFRCSHEIDLRDATTDHIDLAADPVLDWMFHGDRPAVLVDRDGTRAPVVERMLEAFAPNRQLAVPAWLPNRQFLRHELALTNLAPIVFVNSGYSHSNMLGSIQDMALRSPRRIMIISDSTFARARGIELLSTPMQLDQLHDVNMKGLGAELTRRLMLQ